MVQHVTNHTSSHQCEGKLYGDIISFNITSTHHQMMYPFNLRKDKYEILAWSKYFLSDTYLNGEDKEIDKPTNFLEPEIVYFNDTKSLAIQGHPEFGNVEDRTISIIYDYIKQYLINE